MMERYISEEVVRVTLAFNINGEIYLEDDPNTPTITDPSQEGYAIRHIDGTVEWKSKEDFEMFYVPYDNHKERITYLRNLIEMALKDIQLELKLASDDPDYPIIDITRTALINCYKVLDVRISRMK